MWFFWYVELFAQALGCLDKYCDCYGAMMFVVVVSGNFGVISATHPFYGAIASAIGFGIEASYP
jgi:hypothetical protein